MDHRAPPPRSPRHRGRGTPPRAAAAKAALVGLLLTLVLAGCWSEAVDSATPGPVIPTPEDPTAQPTTEESDTDVSVEPSAPDPPQDDEASPVASPEVVVPLASPHASPSPATPVPDSGSPVPDGPTPAEATEIALAAGTATRSVPTTPPTPQSGLPTTDPRVPAPGQATTPTATATFMATASATSTPSPTPTPSPEPPTPTPSPGPIPEATAVHLDAPVAFLNHAREFHVLLPSADRAYKIGGAGAIDTDVAPAFSVDWRWLAMVTADPPMLYLRDLEAPTDQETTPTDLGVAGRPTRLVWSPRDATLAVVVALDGGGYDLILLDAEAGNPARVVGDATRPDAVDRVEWAPDGVHLAIVSSTAGRSPVVEIVNAVTPEREPVRVTIDGPTADAVYGWNSDGHLLVRAGGELWLVDPFGDTSVSLGSVAAAPIAPAWSEDGSAVAFVDQTADAGGQLWIHTLDGSTCPTGFEHVQALAWRPGENRLAVVGARQDGGPVLEFVGADCSTSGTPSPIDQPVERLLWSSDGLNLALIGPSAPDSHARTVELVGVGTIVGVTIGNVLGWVPGAPLLLLFADPAFADPPAEARLWVASAGTSVATHVAGATTPGGYVENAWLPPPLVASASDGPRPRRDPPVPEPTAGPTPANDEPTDDQPQAPTTGSIEVTSVDGHLTALPGACIRLTRADGSGYEPVCDDDIDYDGVVDRLGVIWLDGVASGDYEVAEEPDPDRAPAEPRWVTIVAGEATRVTLYRAPVVPPEGDGPVAGSVSVSWFDAEGHPLPGGCVRLEGATVVGPVCDDQEGDADETGGVVRIDGVAAGDYTAAETQPPTSFAAAQQQSAPVRVDPGAVSTVQFVNAPQPT